MKINLLLNPANRSWIIQKIAEELADKLRQSGIGVSITNKPDPTSDLVHHMSWAFANIRTPQPSTMFITHLDDLFKLGQVRAMLASEVRVGICMSSHTMRQLLEFGCSNDTLYYISPAHDGLISPRKIVIGVTTRVYPDGRKRETLLQEVARRIDLSAFEFRIFGRGWEPTIAVLEAAGAQVAYFAESDDYRKDYDTLREIVPTFDYYLYLGMDEGSLGTLDALACGVATIITPQGFHLDLPNGMTHPVVSAEDLARVLEEIAEPRRKRVASVSALTWAEYAHRHIDLWTAIVEERPLPPLPEITPDSTAEHASARRLIERNIRVSTLSPRRLLSAVSHMSGFRSLRRIVDSLRLDR